MTRSLRSTVTLPGDISNYLLDSSDSMATGGGEETNGVNLQSMVHELSGDPTKLCELLVKNLTIANESNQKMQELLRDRQGQSNTRQNPSFVSKLDECPTKGKYSSLDAWVQEVQLWDQSNSNGSDIESLNTKKYLKFMTSVNNSENCDDLKKLVQVEFKENKDFNKKSNTIIEDMLKVIKEKLDKTDLEKCSEAWVNFINIKQEVSESAAAYVVRFEQVETQLKNVKIVIPNRALAIHLLNKSCLAAQSKENVLTKTNLEDDSEIYSTLKKSVREMKSTLTQNEVLEVKDNNTNSVVAKRENDTYYAGKERGHFKRNVRAKIGIIHISLEIPINGHILIEIIDQELAITDHGKEVDTDQKVTMEELGITETGLTDLTADMRGGKVIPEVAGMKQEEQEKKNHPLMKR